eukprot:scaffold199704_cov28-Tisochrysis_lutea.AAC.1
MNGTNRPPSDCALNWRIHDDADEASQGPGGSVRCIHVVPSPSGRHCSTTKGRSTKERNRGSPCAEHLTTLGRSNTNNLR